MSTRAEKLATQAVFFPLPAQGHVTPALHLAKLLHVRGRVSVTFVHSDRNRRRLLRTRGPAALAGAPGFGFASVPDGLPPPCGEDDDDSPQVMVSLLASLDAFVPHLKKLLEDLSASGAPSTCVVSDIDPVLRAAADVGVRAVAFWTTSACGLLASLHCQQLSDKGLDPLKDEEQLCNGYLDSTVIDPALPTAATAVVLNTFGELEGEVVAAMSAVLPPIYAVGSLPLLTEAAAGPLETLSANLTKEDDGCLAWLGSKEPGSVVYANFGSIVVLTPQQIEEFAWGLANSGYHFLMVLRGAMQATLAPEFVEATKDRGYVTSWCPQRERNESQVRCEQEQDVAITTLRVTLRAHLPQDGGLCRDPAAPLDAASGARICLSIDNANEADPDLKLVHCRGGSQLWES
ncbi:unnamed protein product [Miscanthus lutarioriparius]|uniref:Uncharacterized protein n=1 Tax=Miscanthus lutarioriparius TaxID=422564 RepID=A0A811PNU9_9POAL|nr:unnamed protein product [Miscanthus lutarioriparius]